MICLVYSLFTLIQFLLLYTRFLHHYNCLLWTLQYSTLHHYKYSVVALWLIEYEIGIWNINVGEAAAVNSLSLCLRCIRWIVQIQSKQLPVCSCTVIKLVVATNWMQPNKKCVWSQFVLLSVNWIESNNGEWFWYFDRLGCPNKLI